jgi:hypothetical protein
MKEENRNNMPNFDELNDRIIAEASDSPRISIKTNLDPKNTTEENPYNGENMSKEEQKKHQQFFD